VFKTKESDSIQFATFIYLTSKSIHAVLKNRSGSLKSYYFEMLSYLRQLWTVPNCPTLRFRVFNALYVSFELGEGVTQVVPWNVEKNGDESMCCTTVRNHLRRHKIKF
jgi:hypothetical protein